MTVILARILLSIALLIQGVGAIASEINAELHPHCHMSASGAHGKPTKLPCCHSDECALPNCSTGCPMHGVAFVAPPSLPLLTFIVAASQIATTAPATYSLDSTPALRPPIV